MTQDAGGSAPMRGSHAALHRAVRSLLDGVNARYPDKNPRQWTCPHMQALDDMTQEEPTPTLTEAEQLAVAWAAREADEWDEEDTPEVAAHAEVLRGLAKRLF